VGWLYPASVGDEELVDDLAGSARKCAALRGAVVLADWVGAGRAVTAKGVLRRADVSAAGCALGVELPGWVRSAADVPALHWPWTAALGGGLLSVDGGRAVPGQAWGSWRSAKPGEVLELWMRGFTTALTGLFDDDEGSEALEIGRLALTVLDRDPVLTGVELARGVSHAVLDARLYRTFDRGFGTRDPAEVTMELLTAFGAVADVPKRRITSLGRWALSAIGTRGVSLLGSSDDVDEDATCQLKIVLQHVRPTCWRRVHIPASATLGDLHEVIQVAFAWDDDHLHGFTVGRRRYGDPYFDFEYDENEITLAAVFRARKPITYTYDFGDDWRHEITLEKVVEPNATHPVCVDGRGDAPVEDCGDDEPAWITFDQADVNNRLARLSDRGFEAQLRDDIEVILTDAYGEHEQVTAFQTVLEEEIDFPVPATLLGNPVVVTGLVEDDATLELRARCKGKHAKGLISFADLEFRPGTVEAWLHTAYATYLGRKPSAVTLPAGWDGLTRWVT
jgi:hypothetical protein